MTHSLLPKIPIHDHVGSGLPPLKSPFGFDFIRAKNGMFKRGENEFYKTIMPIGTEEMSSSDGLINLTPEFTLKDNKINSAILEKGLSIAQRFAARDRGPLEAMFFVHRIKDAYSERHILSSPYGGALTSVSVKCPAPDPKNLIMEFHSHHEMGAFFSGTDDKDEVEFRLYGVLGQIISAPAVRFRIGLYGNFMNVNLEQIFFGDLSFIRDANR